MKHLDLFEDNYPNRKDMSDLRLDDLPKTFLTVKADAAATSSTVENNDGFNVANYYVLYEGYGKARAEIATFTSVTGANTITHGALAHNHPKNTPLYLLPYNQIEFSSAPSSGGTKSVVVLKDMQPSYPETYYHYAAGTTALYYYTRYKNNASSVFSGYSDEMPGTGFSAYCFRHLVSRVSHLLGQKEGVWVTRELIEEFVNEGYHQVAARLRDLDEGFFVKETDLDLAADTEYIDLSTPASDFLQVIRLKVAYDGTNFHNATREYPQMRLASHSEYGTTDPHYSFRGNYIYLNPTPTVARTAGAKLLHSYEPTDMSAGTDTPSGIPTTHARGLLLNWALFRSYGKRGDKTSMALYKNLYEDQLNQFIQELSRRDRGELGIQISDEYFSEEVY